MDEKVCHIHHRVTLGAVDEYGHFIPNQTAALEAMGFERPDPTKPRSRYNNALIAFTDSIREIFYQNCERCGLEIDREVQNYSKRQVEILELKCDKFREEMAEAKRQAKVQQEAAKQAEIVLGQTQQSIKELNAKITQLTAENTGLKVENEALKNQLADLRQRITDTKKLQDKAEQDRADAVKKLEDIENYQKGLFRQWQS
jgi:regulator of replication initiation timing